MADELRGQPKRWKWTRRLLWALSVFWIITIVGRLWWGWYADRKLQDQLDAIAARGEPIEWKDVFPPPIPDEQNAAHFYELAVTDAIFDDGVSPKRGSGDRTPRLAEMVDDLVYYPELRQARKAEVEEILDLASEGLALARKARGLKASYWQVDFSVPAMFADQTPLAGRRQLSRALRLAALAAHERGDDAAAVEYVRDMFALSRSVGALPGLISLVAATGLEAQGCYLIEQIAPTLAVREKSGDAVREEIERFIPELLDESDIRRRFVMALIAERSMEHDTCERFRGGDFYILEEKKLGPWACLVLDAVSAPVWELDEARLLHWCTEWVQAAKERTYPAVTARIPALPEAVYARDPGITRLLSSVLVPSLTRIAELHFRFVAMRRMSATALGVRLYELDHGHRPAKLEELAPRYIPFVPTDVFSPNVAPLGYLPEGKPPLLYSIGRDGKDDNGSYRPGQAGRLYVGEPQDIVFFLDGDRPRAPYEPGEDGEGARGQVQETRPADPAAPGPTSTTDTSGPTSQSRPAPRKPFGE